MPAVAEITAGSGFSAPGGGGGTATGSGFLIDREGHVVTNEHVVSGAETVRVLFGDGDDLQADVVGTDPSTDVALLRLDGRAGRREPLQLGAASSLEIGQPCSRSAARSGSRAPSRPAS